LRAAAPTGAAHRANDGRDLHASSRRDAMAVDVIAWRPIALLSMALAMPALLVVATGMLTGSTGELWDQTRAPLLILAAMLAAAAFAALGTTIARVRARRARELTRFELTLSQSDEATHEETAAACEHLVQLLRCTLTERVCGGQPWLAIEAWHVPRAPSARRDQPP
jgi:hypothetical protein